MSSSTPEDLDSPSFEPGWPDIAPAGLIIARSGVTQRDEPIRPDLDDDDVSWTLHLGVADSPPLRLAFIGELTVSNAAAFAGVTVLMPFHLRDEPLIDLDDLAERRGILDQYGRWASSVMYDHAAMAARSMLAGNGLPLTVPFGTPEVTLDYETASE